MNNRLHVHHKIIQNDNKPTTVTCLATNASLTADPGVASSIPARSHTFVEIDHEILIIQEGLLSVTSESMCTKLVQACPGKSVVR